MTVMAASIRRMHRSFIRIHALSYAVREGEVYGLQVQELLGRFGYSLSPGTLYPILHEMERAGLLRAKNRVVDGKVRRYYRPTPQGCEYLLHMKALIRELASVLLETQLPNEELGA